MRRIAALVAAKDFQRAADFAGQAQTQHPDDLRFPQFRAHALLQMGDAPRAITVLEPVAKANPNDAATQLSLADLYSNAGRKNDAERTVRQLSTTIARLCAQVRADLVVPVDDAGAMPLTTRSMP